MKTKHILTFFLIVASFLFFTSCSEISKPISRFPDSIDSIRMFFAIVGITTIIAISIDLLLNIIFSSSPLVSTFIVMIIIIWQKDYGFFAVAGIAILTLILQVLIGRIIGLIFAFIATILIRYFNKE